ncbi:MAG TPA: glycogen/starch synthase [Rubrobacter sp.]|nr:glycogen/starch synthase [Rubrobacter sp.]
MKILFAIAEAYPFLKVGGLADVGGGLPKALAGLGHDVTLVLPGHPALAHAKRAYAFDVPMGPATERADVLDLGRHWGVEVAAVWNEDLFARAAYGGHGYEDDEVIPFVYFAKAVAALAARPGSRPDVVHCNDWHTALVPREMRRGPFAGKLADTATVLTIHNLAYQGRFGPEAEMLVPVEAGEERRLLEIGVNSADVVNTVSRGYLEEIVSPKYGMGMDRALRARNGDLCGVLNGVDYEAFDPSFDPHLHARYDGPGHEGKRRNKEALQKMSGLPEEPEVPLLGMVARLVDQKGVDLLHDALGGLLDLGVQVVAMGTGEERYAGLLREAALAREGFAYHPTGEEALARQVYAGTDLFLSPSSFEPCGLAPLVALRYGSIPVVRHTGGMKDTIADYDADPDAGLGFVFAHRSVPDLVSAVRRAVALYRRPDAWHGLQERAMAADFSWEGPARRYEELYEKARATRPRRIPAEGIARRRAWRRERRAEAAAGPRVPVALVHHANQYLITDGYEDRQGISDVVEGYAAALRLHEKYGVQANLHLSGTLVETVAWHCPWFLELVKRLRDRGVVSLLGGTYSENVMTLFSPAFNRRQLDEFLWLHEHHLGVRPEEMGTCWVPERVWDTGALAPVLTDGDLANGGYRHVLLDDRLLYPANGSYPKSPRARFDASGPFEGGDLAPSAVESRRPYRISGGRGLSMAPISADLRYAVPPGSGDQWRRLETILGSFPSEGDAVLVYADDLERTAGVGGWDPRALRRYEGFLRWLASRADAEAVSLQDRLDASPPREERELESGAFFELARGWDAEEDYRGWWENPAWSPYRGHLAQAQETVRSAQRAGADERLTRLAWKHLLASAYETAWHDPTEEGLEPAPWARAVASHSRSCRVMADAARWFAG